MKPSHPALTLIFVAATCICFTTQTSKVVPAAQQAVSLTAGSDPLQVVKAINDNSRRSGELRLVDFWAGLNIPGGPFDICSGNCEAAASYQDLNGKPGRELLLKLTWSTEFCRFLIFESKADGWKFVGHIDHDFNRYEMATHRVVQFGDRPWLVIRSQAGSGSGYALYEHTWYEVTSSGVAAVLNYPESGQTYPWPTGLAREFHVQINNRGKKLSVNYAVNYYAYESPKSAPLFINQHTAVYRWDSSQRAFVFDDKASNIAQAEIDAIANIETEPEPESEGQVTIGNTKFYSENKQFVGSGYEVFLRHNFRGLMKIANDKRNPIREWLKQLLADCDDSKEKRELMSVLHR